MKIYTRTGDDGTTGLYGGDRVEKTHPRIVTYGTVDEANALIGLARSGLASVEACAELVEMLEEIQSDLFVLGADLATPLDARSSVPRITEQHIERVEERIDRISAQLPELKNFILPGGSQPAATLHVARTVCRRAERLAVELSSATKINPETVVYLNRLSDLLFVLARRVNQLLTIKDTIWRHPED